MGSSKADKLVATKSVPLLPLDGALLFPRAVLPLHIFENRYVDLVDDALSSNRLIGLIQPQPTDAQSDVPQLQNHLRSHAAEKTAIHAGRSKPNPSCSQTADKPAIQSARRLAAHECRDR